MRTVPPATSIQKVEFLLPSPFLALQVYWPESSNLAWRIVRMLLLLIFNPSLVQSILGEGKLLTEQWNWSDELYVTDWFLSSGLISGGPGYRINKQNSKKGKRMTKTKKIKKHYKMRRESKGNKTKSTFTYDCNMESWFNVPFTVFSATSVLTSISKSYSINRENVVVTKIQPILSPEYLWWREAAYRAFELKRWIICNQLILELRIDFRRT